MMYHYVKCGCINIEFIKYNHKRKTISLLSVQLKMMKSHTKKKKKNMEIRENEKMIERLRSAYAYLNDF